MDVSSSSQGLHTTRYVKSVYRQLHEEADMVVPVSGGPGYRTVRDFRLVSSQSVFVYMAMKTRWFTCKKNRYFWDVQEAAFVKVWIIHRPNIECVPG